MTEDLFHEFIKSLKNDWIVQATKETKKEDVERAFSLMVWDKIPQLPFYTQEDFDFFPKQVRFQPDKVSAGFPPRIWNNVVSVLPGESHEKIVHALENGAEGLVLHLHGMENLNELLKGVLPEFIPILILPLGNPISVLTTFLDWVETTGTPKEAITGGLIWTPSDVIFERNEPFGLGLEVLTELLDLSQTYPNFKPFCLKTSRYSESGGNPMEALVFGLGELIDILNAFGENSGSIFSKFFLEASVGENHFGELARMKAFRTFVSELAGLYSMTVKEEDIVLLCRTSHWSKSKIDENTNLIRQTYEAMSAVLGGANWLWVRPFEEENTGELERRMARNVSNILREEGHLDKVQDPSAGAYYLEKLIIESLFFLRDQLKELEAGGGWEKAIERGAIHQSVRRDREKIQIQVLENSIPKIGVNRYPDPKKLDKLTDFNFFEEKRYQLKPTRSSYLVELQTQAQP